MYLGMPEDVRVEHEIFSNALCVSGSLFALRIRPRQRGAGAGRGGAAAGVNTEGTEAERHRALKRALRTQQRQI